MAAVGGPVAGNLLEQQGAVRTHLMEAGQGAAAQPVLWHKLAQQVDGQLVESVKQEASQIKVAAVVSGHMAEVVFHRDRR